MKKLSANPDVALDLHTRPQIKIPHMGRHRGPPPPRAVGSLGERVRAARRSRRRIGVNACTGVGDFSRRMGRGLGWWIGRLIFLALPIVLYVINNVMHVQHLQRLATSSS